MKKQRLYFADGVQPSGLQAFRAGEVRASTLPTPTQAPTWNPAADVRMQESLRGLQVQNGINPLNQGGGASGTSGKQLPSYDEHRDAEGDYSLNWTLPTTLPRLLARLGATVSKTFRSHTSKLTVQNASTTTTSGRKKSADKYARLYLEIDHQATRNQKLIDQLNALNDQTKWWYDYELKEDYVNDVTGQSMDVFCFNIQATGADAQEQARNMLAARLKTLVKLGAALNYLEEQGHSTLSTTNPDYAATGGFVVKVTDSVSGYNYTLAYTIPYAGQTSTATPKSTTDAPDDLGDTLDQFEEDYEEQQEADPTEAPSDNWTLLGFTLPKMAWIGIAAGVVLLLVTIIALIAKKHKK